MANFVASNLAKAQAMLTGAFQAGELRVRTPEVFNFFTRSGQIMLPNYEQLRTSESRPFEAYFKHRTSRASAGARIHNHTGTKGDSGVLSPTWVTYSDIFTNTLKSGDSNVYNNAEQLAAELENVFFNFAESLESGAANFLFSNRTTVNAATAEGTFNAVNDAFEITDTTNGDRAIQITQSMMFENKYTSGLTVVCDSIAWNKFGFQANQGNANSQNLSFQFAGITFIHSVELNALAASLSYTKGFWVAVPNGMVASLPWIPKQNREGHVSTVNTYGSLINPIDMLTYAVHSYEERIDGTAFNAETQDVKTEFQVSIDVAFDHAPLSAAGETPLFAAALI